MQTPSGDSSHSPVWSLPSGGAQTFYARTAGVLRVRTGRAWATVSPRSGHPQQRATLAVDSRDLFVLPGQDLQLHAGQNVVLESWPTCTETNTVLHWEAAPASASALCWQARVKDPLHELGQGMGQTVRALLRLVAGVASYSEYLVAGRGKVQSALDCNAP